MFFRLLPRAPASRTQPWFGLAAAAVAAEAAPAGQIVAGEAVGRLLHFVGRALKNDLPAAFAGAGSDLDDLIGGPNDRLLMLDHDNRIAPVAKLLDRAEKLVDVAGMQPDRRLVEHVEHVHQAGAEGRGERHAARLAAAEGSQRAVEREVAEPDGFEISEPGLHLFEHHAADLPLVVGQIELAEEGGGVADLHRRDLADVPAADPRGQRLGPQPRSAARRTDAKTPPAAEKHADVHLVLPPFEPGEEALQPAKLPLRHAVDDQVRRAAPRAGETARRWECRNRGPAPAVPSVRGRRPACSTARWPPRGAICPGRERSTPCPAR